ncbi:hypothetical protein [Flaviaesturariibacter aridisoli]|uniref:Uncharacterized protein n=1 Tax=Flaviaesturariibacter aridisoli TaxID=2545761 RepID=A0A4R4E8Q4_9BACT|nr:hypothetical protein [Flaviaesturariibacter aridisoli]TCZ74481.1 hypothetical protein E0486_02320 [Flaviaesturariibacter aridisoli]
MVRNLRHRIGASAICLSILPAASGLISLPTATASHDDNNNLPTSPTNYSSSRLFPGTNQLPCTATQGLPQHRIHLRGLLRSGTVELLWDITDEVDIASYTVERSTDGTAFTAIGEVRSSGNHCRYTYQFRDNRPALASPTNYYRIQARERSGGRFYSATKTLRQAAGDSGAPGLTVGANAATRSPKKSFLNNGSQPSTRFI